MEGLLGIDVRGMIWIVGRFDKGVVRMKFGMIPRVLKNGV
jgi:hypothetical protein